MSGYHFPLTGGDTLHFDRLVVNKNRSIQAWSERRNAGGEVLAAGYVVASPHEPVLLLGREKLGVDVHAEMLIAKLLQCPSDYEAIYRKATAPVEPLPLPPPLAPDAELLVRIAGYANQAGRAEGFALGLLAATQAAPSPETPLAPPPRPSEAPRSGTPFSLRRKGAG